MKYYKDDDVLPTILIAMLITSFMVLALHHKNEMAYKNAVAERQAVQLTNLREMLKIATEPIDKRNEKGERI